MQHLIVAKVVSLCDPLLPNLQGMESSKHGSIPGWVHCYPGTRCGLLPAEPFLEPSIPWHILWREQVLLII